MDIKKSYITVMDDHFPDTMQITFGDATLSYKKRTWKIQEGDSLMEKGLRYGENPGQEAALYELVNGNLALGGCTFISPGNSLASGIDEESLIQPGKHPSKINFTDIDNSLNILKYLSDKPATVIVKHNNPCGVAVSSSLAESFSKAFAADRIAAFGGCAAFNRGLDKATAELIASQYFEVVAAPEYDEGTVDILKKRKNLRIIKIARMDKLNSFKNSRFVDFKSLIDGGIIVQQSPLNIINSVDDLKTAETECNGKKYSINRAPTKAECDDMLFGWFVEQGITSNSVIYVKNGVTVGIGTGEQDRVGVAEIAVYKAYTKYADNLCYEKFAMPFKDMELKAKTDKTLQKNIDEILEITKNDKAGLIGSSMVSDAFFPFRDGADVGINQGITSIIQPGGSLRDYEIIEACNGTDPQVTMVFTGQRAFKH